MRFVYCVLTLTFLACSSRGEQLDTPVDVRDATSPAAVDSCLGCTCVGQECPGYQACLLDRCVTPDPRGAVCEFDSNCDAGKMCALGRCTLVTCVPEQCDGVDNDCDGEVDSVGGRPLSEYCFGGDPSQLGFPPCQQGVRVCDHGVWSACTGAVDPTLEVGTFACDGVDNDCDGCVDSINLGSICSTPPDPALDVVFVVDHSGSMFSTINGVIDAFDQLGQYLADQGDSRIAYVRFPSTVGEEQVYDMVFDFVPYEQATLLMDAARDSESVSSYEASYDVLWMLGNGVVPLSWRNNASRLIFMTTDEAGQSYVFPVNTETTACATFVHGEKISVLTKTEFSYHFDECSTIFTFSSSTDELYEVLQESVTDACVKETP